MKKETEKLVKNLAVHEKAEVQFQEKRKHALSKRKKLEKTLEVVSGLPDPRPYSI